MASLRFPDTGSRYIFLPSGRPAINGRAYVYADAAHTVPAEIYRDINGAKGAQVPLDDDGRVSIRLDNNGGQLDYWGPVSGQDRLFIVVNGVGSVADADYNARIDAVETTVAAAATVVGLAAHVADTTDVHGIPDTAVLETLDGAQAKADAAVDAAATDATSKVGAHSADTTNVHGITDTALLETTAGAQDKATAAQAAAVSSSVQKSANLSDVNAGTARTNLGLGTSATRNVGTTSGDVAAGDAPAAAQTAAIAAAASDATSKVAAEATARSTADALLTPQTRTITAGTGLTGGGTLSADRTLSVAYGTTSTTAARGDDTRLSDARTPTSHAASHASGGSDPVTVAQSQVTGLSTALGAKADLVGGLVPTSQIPPSSATYRGEVASEAAMLALPAVKGDYARRTDTTPNTFWTLIGTDATVIGSWLQTSSAGAVSSVNSQSGNVVLGPADVGAVPTGRTVTTTSPLTGGGALSGNLTLGVTTGTTAGTVAAGDAPAAAQAFAVQRTNHTGTQSADTLTDGTTNKAFLATERTKLAGIATGATANVDATTGVKGIVQLAGDLAGTSAAPTVPALTGKASKLTTTATKTSAYTAAPNELVPADATSGAFPITLPSAATAGAGAVVVVRKIDASSNGVTVQRAGSDTINAAATSVILTLADEAMTYTSDGISKWAVSAGLKSLASLDARYVRVSDRDVSVKDSKYGVTGNGTTEDTAGLRSAFADAAAAGVGVVFPDSGTYIVAPSNPAVAMIDLPAGLKSVYSLGAATIKVKSGVGDYYGVFRNTGSTNVDGLVIRNITIDQNNRGNQIADASPTGPLFTGYPRYAIIVAGGMNTGMLQVRNVRFYDIDNVNTLVFGGRDVIFDSCRFEFGTSPSDHDHSAIYTNITVAGGESVITNNVFMALTVGANGARTAIETHGGTQTVTGNTVRNYVKGANITGIALTSGDGIHVADNSILDCRYGIGLWSYAYQTNTGPYGLQNCHVHDNTIRLDPAGQARSGMADTRGIYLDPTSDLPVDTVHIENNIIVTKAGWVGSAADNSAHGIDWRRTVAPTNGLHDRNVFIRGNTITAPVASGVRIAHTVGDYGDTFVVSDNTIRNVGQGTVAAGGALSNGYSNGIMVAAALKNSDVRDNTIVDDQVTPTTNDGLYLIAPGTGSANNACAGNRIPVANNRRIELSASVSGGWLLRADHESSANVPSGIVRYGSMVNITSTGATYLQTTAPEGNTWAQVPTPGIRAYETTIFNSSRYYGPAGGRTTGVQVLNSEYATPLWVGETVTLDRIGIEVTAIAGVTAGHTTRLGIRADNGNGLPGTLVLDAGTVASDAVAQVEATISVALTPGLYWLTATPQGSGTQPTYRCVTGTSGVLPTGAGTLAQATSATQYVAYTQTGVTGALPSTYTWSNNLQAGVLVVVRAASGQ